LKTLKAYKDKDLDIEILSSIPSDPSEKQDMLFKQQGVDDIMQQKKLLKLFRKYKPTGNKTLYCALHTLYWQRYLS
jgi:hypothetical protein